MNIVLCANDLIANAIIEKLDRCHETFVTHDEMKAYKDACKKWYAENTNIACDISWGFVEVMQCVNDHWFTFSTNCIALTPDKQTDIFAARADLCNHFRTYLSGAKKKCLIEAGAVFEKNKAVEA